MKTVQIDDYTIHRGENAMDNWELVETSEPNWIWLHLNSFSSPHIVIESAEPESYIISAAASMCREHTKYKNLPNLKFCYTPISNLEKGTETGSVTFKSHRKIKFFKM